MLQAKYFNSLWTASMRQQYSKNDCFKCTLLRCVDQWNLSASSRWHSNFWIFWPNDCCGYQGCPITLTRASALSPNPRPRKLMNFPPPFGFCPSLLAGQFVAKAIKIVDSEKSKCIFLVIAPFNRGQYFDKHLKYIKHYTGHVPFTQHDLYYLAKVCILNVFSL